MHRQHHIPNRDLSRRTERALGVVVALITGTALAELLAQWAMGWGVI